MPAYSLPRAVRTASAQSSKASGRARLRLRLTRPKRGLRPRHSVVLPSALVRGVLRRMGHHRRRVVLRDSSLRRQLGMGQPKEGAGEG